MLITCDNFPIRIRPRGMPNGALAVKAAVFSRPLVLVFERDFPSAGLTKGTR